MARGPSHPRSCGRTPRCPDGPAPSSGSRGTGRTAGQRGPTGRSRRSGTPPAGPRGVPRAGPRPSCPAQGALPAATRIGAGCTDLVPCGRKDSPRPRQDASFWCPFSRGSVVAMNLPRSGLPWFRHRWSCPVHSPLTRPVRSHPGTLQGGPPKTGSPGPNARTSGRNSGRTAASSFSSRPAGLAAAPPGAAGERVVVGGAHRSPSSSS